ncbi:MAG: hypothetical protein U0359_34915 [Byssovorax sp.]
MVADGFPTRPEHAPWSVVLSRVAELSGGHPWLVNALGREERAVTATGKPVRVWRG